MSPLELVTNIVPDISTSFKFPFGCPVTSSKEEQKVALTQPKSEIGIALGTSPGSNKSVLIYIPGRGIKPFNRLNVQYLHINFPAVQDSSRFTPIYDDLLNVAFSSPVSTDTKVIGTSGFNFFLPMLEDLANPVLSSSDLEHTSIKHVFSIQQRTPNNPTLAAALKNWARWSIPSDKELATIDELGCVEQVTRDQVPPGAQILPTKMDFKSKFDSLGQWLKDKARLVVLGNLEILLTLMDYYSPTAHSQTLHLLLALAAQFQMTLRGLDIYGAFLTADIDEPVYIQLPKGLPNKWGEGAIFRLR
jgi:hypothetical protein